MGALSVVISAILSSWFLQEKLSLFGWLGCSLCIVRLVAVAIIIFRSAEADAVRVMTADRICRYCAERAFRTIYRPNCTVPAHVPRTRFYRLDKCAHSVRIGDYFLFCTKVSALLFEITRKLIDSAFAQVRQEEPAVVYYGVQHDRWYQRVRDDRSGRGYCYQCSRG